jgi:hypothetical protein
MAKSFTSLFALIMGSVLVMGGVSVRSKDVIADASSAVNQANIHQLATVVELYYSDHGSYPNVSGGKELIDLLEREEYIRNRPLDPEVFTYEPKNNAQDFTLKLDPSRAEKYEYEKHTNTSKIFEATAGETINLDSPNGVSETN